VNNLNGLLKRLGQEPVWHLAAGAIVLMFSLVVMLSWKLGIESLIRVHPSWSPTQFNTALSCALLALSSLSMAVSWRTARVLAVLAMLMAAATGLQYILGSNFGIDELFHRHQFRDAAALAGRMSINSCVVIVTLGLSLAFHQPASKASGNTLFSLLTTALAASLLTAFLIGYVLGEASLFNLSDSTGIGALTLAMTGAICGVQIGRALKVVLPALKRLHVPVMLASAVFMASFSLAVLFGMEAQQRNAALEAEAAELRLHAATLEARVSEQVLSLERMADRWRAANGTPEAHWRADAANYITDSRLFSAMSVVSAEGRIRWAEPAAADSQLRGLDLMADTIRGPAFARMRDSGQTTVSPVFDLQIRGLGFIIMIPLYLADGRFDGAVVEAYELERLDAVLAELPQPETIPVTVRPPDFPVDASLLVQPVYLGGPDPILLTVSRDAVLAATPMSASSALFLAFALAASGLGLLALHLSIQGVRQKHALAIVNEELATANAELDSFAYTASHDLKSPLRGIRQLADWLEEDLSDRLTDDTRRYIDLMHSRIGRLQNLLDALLQYSRVGRKAISRSDIGVRDAIATSIDLLDLPEGHAVHLEGENFEIFTDINLLQVIVMNLVSNASKHHDGETAGIRVHWQSLADGWQLEISDDGPGIPTDLHQRVFKMFETVKSRDELEASGMGLAIVAKAVTRLDGCITLISNPAEARGSRFVLEFEHDR
jgi:signal transduction histidine kinase